MIDRDLILAQMEILARQRQEALDQVQRVDGAFQLCRHWLAELDEREARTLQAEQAQRNGRAPSVLVDVDDSEG